MIWAWLGAPMQPTTHGDFLLFTVVMVVIGVVLGLALAQPAEDPNS